jgi:glycosyltransferase involved in cell wall biosynthesis/SAM-dependent methyltransferase
MTSEARVALCPGVAEPVPAATVGVVITTYNHAHFLGEALDSVRAQTRAADDIVVVDDGSEDNPGEVVARFPGVRCIRQDNRGLAAARNTGLTALSTRYVIFLDADDRLEPRAIAAGLACFARAPDSGFVYGGHIYVDRDGNKTGERFEPPGESPYLHLLRRNFIAMHGTVMYRRDLLDASGGFDERLRRGEDYDVYLRMVRQHPIAAYPDLVAAYRLHGQNMSADHRGMLRTMLDVHASHAPPEGDSVAARAWSEGRRHWRRYYAEEMARARYRRRQGGVPLSSSLAQLARIAAVSPQVAARDVLGGLRRRVAALLPRHLAGRLMLSRRDRVPPVGHVQVGDLRRLKPISGSFGFDRGLPVDRYYIERFLARNASEILGRVLEVGDDGYTRKFGGSRVTRSDVLHVAAGNPRATIVGDVSDPRVLPDSAFNCIIFTQTLQLIYDVRAAVAQLHRALAPGGVALVTAPGISQIDRGEWGNTWFWSFTPTAMERLFGDVFGPDAVMVGRYGNVFAATMFLQGLAVEELDTRDLQPIDRAYPVIVSVRARKPR